MVQRASSFFQSIDMMNSIRPMKLTALDLNLLTVLDALLTESSVARAASRLGRSQPAVSHSLRHLRQLFADPLLVRSGHKMLLTPKAESLRLPLRGVLEGAASLFNPDEFDPRTSNRRFRLMIPDFVASVLLPGLAQRISTEAPSIVLETVGWRGPDMMTADFSRTIDIIVSWSEHSFPGFHRHPLYRDRDCLAFRIGHPAAGRLSSLEGFLDARHIAVIGAGETADPIDAWLAGSRVERRVAAVVASYVQALQVAATTDMVAFAPGRTIAALAPRLGLDRCNPPIDPGEDQQLLFIPARCAQDPAINWLRTMIVTESQAELVDYPYAPPVAG
jgi:DNA-binding transcriptional LysR family regulator